MTPLYFLLQISACVGYLGHQTIVTVWNQSNRSSTARQIKFLSQCLMISALILPFALQAHWFHRSILPNVIRRPLAEAGTQLNQAITSAVESSSEKGIENRSIPTLHPVLEFPPFLLIPSLIVTGFLIGLYRVISNLLRLRTQLQGSHRFRKYRNLTLAVSDNTSVPFSAWYFGQRWIVFPQSLLRDRTRFVLSLKHEIQHHRVNDTIWAFTLECIGPIFFFNPLFLFWKRAILELQEFSCDESLILQRNLNAKTYGECLVEVAAAAVHNRTNICGIAGMANHHQSKTSLERRVSMLTSKTPRRNSTAIAVLAGFTFFFLVASTVSVRALANMSTNAPTPGVAVVDPKVQAIAEKILFEALEEYRATAGFALVSEAQTGRLLAVANINSNSSAPHSPHWALSLRVEPASVMKALIAAAALEKGVTQPNEIHNCENGKLLIGDKEYGDWKPFDKLTTAETVAQSSNICGIKIGRKLGAVGIQDSLKQFGFAASEITSQFPEARPGILPSVEELGAEHYMGRIPSGFGMYTTPLEIVQVFGAIANGGNLYAPTQANQKFEGRPVPLRRIFSDQTSSKMREILGLVMTKGTANLSQGKKYLLAGKTGTAHSPWLVDRDTAAADSRVAHFVGFGPLDAPKYVVYVGIQDPKNKKDHRAHGSAHAAPVFRDIIEAVLSEKR